MKYRRFGKTGWKVSEIGLGTWGIGGGEWGDVPEKDAEDAVAASLESGVNLIDTADVYGDGRSEKIVANVLKSVSDRIYVLTKVGKRLDPHVAEGYNYDNMSRFVDRCLEYLNVPKIDMVQLHCPPSSVYDSSTTFDALDKIVDQGKIEYYGTSVELVDDAIKALQFPNLAAIQIVFHMFRHKPIEGFLEQAKEKDVAVLARVPLASGLLSGRMNASTQFIESDHRHFNRDGKAFDYGETFGGVPFEVGLEAVEEVRKYVPQGANMAQMALRWILMFDVIGCVIPGAKNRKQAADNAKAADLPALEDDVMTAIQGIYNSRIREHVHQRW